MHLVTGGAGFIGSNIVAALIKKSFDVIVVDVIDHELKLKYLKNLRIKKIIDPIDLFTFIKKNKKKIESVIHMGATTSTAEKNLKILFNNNTNFSLKIFNICNKYSIKLIYASSAATYGDGSHGFSDKNTISNFIRLKPLNYYGVSKHLFDLEVIKEISINNKINSRPVGLKFFNVYGNNELHKGTMMSPIAKFYYQIRDKKLLKLFRSHNINYTDGFQSRDFIYIKDCIDVVLWFLQNPSKQGIYNVGTSKAESFLKLGNIIFKNLNTIKKIKFIDTPKNIRNGYQYKTKADISSIREIGYSRKFTNLKKGVEDYVECYLS